MRRVCLPTGYTVAVCHTYNGVTYGQSIRCYEGRVINITSATVGYRQYREHDGYTRHSEECTISDHVQCRQRTNSPEIMECNGLQRCSISLHAFNYPENFICDGPQKGNYIEVTYNCSAGKRKCCVMAFHKSYVEKNDCSITT